MYIILIIINNFMKFIYIFIDGMIITMLVTYILSLWHKIYKNFIFTFQLNKFNFFNIYNVSHIVKQTLF